MNYNTSIYTGGLGGDIGNRIAGLSSAKPPTLMHNLFNTPAYLRQGMNDQQKAEMQRQSDDQFRSDLWRSKAELGRQYGRADAQLRMAQTNAASNAALNNLSLLSAAAEQQRQNAAMRPQVGMSLFSQFSQSPLMSSLFG